MTEEEKERADIVAGSAVGDNWPGIYLVGSFDDRITFYAQQVRAMNLVDALVSSGTVRDGGNIAVIGAGAAGLAIAASLTLLLPTARVKVFERKPECMPLQSKSKWRYLHPHIYDWPETEAEADVASLPILNWSAATAEEVAREVREGFHLISSARGGQLKITENRNLLSIEKQRRGGYLLEFKRREGENLAQPFDTVFLTVGFGVERTLESGAGTASSYWDDANVPMAHYERQDIETVIVSGGGDGGLTDFAAASLRDFDHSALIREVANATPNNVKDALLDIERRASEQQTFDFRKAYDDSILAEVRRAGLTELFEDQIYPDRKIILNSTAPTALHQNDPHRRASTLNKFIAYLLLNTHPSPGSIEYKGGKLAALDARNGTYLIGGEQIQAQLVYVRHGPLVDKAFSGFAEIGAVYKERHNEWLRRPRGRGAAPLSLTEAAFRNLNDARERSRVRVAARPGAAERTRIPVVPKPEPSAALRICALPIGVPQARPANLLMVLGATRQSAIAVTTGISGGEMVAGLKATEEMLRRVSDSRFSPRNWTLCAEPEWPSGDAPAGLVWTPSAARPPPERVARALAGARWASRPDPGDVLIIALEPGSADDARQWIAHVQFYSEPDDERHSPRIPVYCWTRGSRVALEKIRAVDGALSRLMARLENADPTCELSRDVEAALAMRLAIASPSGLEWKTASRNAIRLYDLSVLQSENAERPQLADINRALALIDLSLENDVVRATLPFLPVSTSILRALLSPENFLARTVAGPASAVDIENIRVLGATEIAESYSATRSHNFVPASTILEPSRG